MAVHALRRAELRRLSLPYDQCPKYCDRFFHTSNTQSISISDRRPICRSREDVAPFPGAAQQRRWPVENPRLRTEASEAVISYNAIASSRYPSRCISCCSYRSPTSPTPCHTAVIPTNASATDIPLDSRRRALALVPPQRANVAFAQLGGRPRCRQACALAADGADAAASRCKRTRASGTSKSSPPALAVM